MWARSSALRSSEACAAGDYFVAMVDECLEQFFQVESARTSVYNCDIVDRERRLHLGELVQFVEYNVGVGVTFKAYHDTHALVVALVVEVGYAVDFFSLTRSAIYLMSSALFTL